MEEYEEVLNIVLKWVIQHKFDFIGFENSELDSSLYFFIKKDNFDIHLDLSVDKIGVVSVFKNDEIELSMGADLEKVLKEIDKIIT